MKDNFLDQLKNAHKSGNFANMIRDLAKSGELFEVFPKLHHLSKVPQDPRWHPEGDVWTHTLLVIDNLPKNATFAMALSALFHDVGKSTTTVIHETGRISSHGHERDSVYAAKEALGVLGADEALIADVSFLIRYHMVAHSKDANIKTLRRLVREGGVELVDQLLQHGVADVAGGSRYFDDCERLRKLFDTL